MPHHGIIEDLFKKTIIEGYNTFINLSTTNIRKAKQVYYMNVYYKFKKDIDNITNSNNVFDEILKFENKLYKNKNSYGNLNLTEFTKYIKL